MAAVAVATGCNGNKQICGTADYQIVNQIEFDIVVVVKSDNGQPKIIISGETQMFHHSEWCRDAKFDPAMTPEVLQAEMRIDGVIIPRKIWMSDYWDTDSDIENHYNKYTLIVTDELLKTITNQQTK